MHSQKAKEYKQITYKAHFVFTSSSLHLKNAAIKFLINYL